MGESVIRDVLGMRIRNVRERVDVYECKMECEREESPVKFMLKSAVEFVRFLLSIHVLDVRNCQ